MSFREILSDFVAEHPVVRAMILCDDQGERVDSIAAQEILENLTAGNTDAELQIQQYTHEAVDAYALALLGASYAVLPHALVDHEVKSLRVVHEKSAVFYSPIMDGYYLVTLAAKDGALNILQRHLDFVVGKIAAAM